MMCKQGAGDEPAVRAGVGRRTARGAAAQGEPGGAGARGSRARAEPRVCGGCADRAPALPAPAPRAQPPRWPPTLLRCAHGAHLRPLQPCMHGLARSLVQLQQPEQALLRGHASKAAEP